jgi:pyridoxal 5'-phosphate synthase pdxS subunit
MINKGKIPGFTTDDIETKIGFSHQLCGGVIMDVTTREEAELAEESGAVAVMALERVPSDIRKEGGVARMADLKIIEEISKAVTIPVMAKCRIGHFIEAEILQEMRVDFIDESEVLTPADNENHIIKSSFKTPFVCGCRDLGEALRRINEGASLIRTKGEAGTGNIVEAVKQMKNVNRELEILCNSNIDNAMEWSLKYKVPIPLIKWVMDNNRLPVPNFSAGGIATPADAALMMRLGAESVFVGSGIFKSENPKDRANAIVKAVSNYEDPSILKNASMNLGKAMSGLNIEDLNDTEKFSRRGV